MSGHESIPRDDAGNIVDKEGVPIVETARDQVAVKKDLARKQHAATLKSATLGEKVVSMWREIDTLPIRVGANEAEQAEYRSKREALSQDSDLLLHGKFEEHERTQEARTELAKNDADSRAHVDENLPAYVQTATELANADLQHRVGEDVPVTSVVEGVIGHTQAELVDPARQKTDVEGPLVQKRPVPIPEAHDFNLAGRHYKV